MGEYARFNGTDIKIGTCENMYYLRFEDRYKVRPIAGNVNPARVTGLRWRLPFPDEDHCQPGSHKEYNRGLRLYKVHELDSGRVSCEDYPTTAEMAQSAGYLQLTHACGLLVNVPCYHGYKLPSVGDGKAFWNGRGHFIELLYVKNLASGDIVPIIGCRHCGELWRADWSDVLPWVADAAMRTRLSRYAMAVATATGAI